MSLNKVNTYRYLTIDTHGYMFTAMKTTLAERLKLAMDMKGFNQAQLAEAAGIAQPSIFKILSGKTQKSGHIVEIAVALGVRPEWLDMNLGPMKIDTTSEFDGEAQPPVVDGVVFISMWDGDKQLNDFIAAPRGTNPRCSKAYKLNRDTGFPDATSGSIIVVDTVESPENNDYVYAVVHGSASIYRFVPGEVSGFLVPAAQGIPPIPVSDIAKIIGVVVYISRRVK